MPTYKLALVITHVEDPGQGIDDVVGKGPLPGGGLLCPLALGNVRADAQDLGYLSLGVRHDPVGPTDPDALPVAAHVLIDILLECLWVCADLLHELLQIAAVALGWRDDGAD